MSPVLIINKMHGDRVVERYEFAHPQRQRIKIGRMRKADIHLEDHTVSRLHAVIELYPGKAVLKELGTLIGLCLNGEHVCSTDRQLNSDDQILIGNTTLAVNWETVPVIVGSPLEPQPAQLPPRSTPPVQAQPHNAPASPSPSQLTRVAARARDAFLSRVSAISDSTAIELDQFLVQLRSQRPQHLVPAMATPTPWSPPADGLQPTSVPEFYDTRRLVARMRRDHRRGRLGILLLLAMALAAFIFAYNPPSLTTQSAESQPVSSSE